MPLRNDWNDSAWILISQKYTLEAKSCQISHSAWLISDYFDNWTKQFMTTINIVGRVPWSPFFHWQLTNMNTAYLIIKWIANSSQSSKSNLQNQNLILIKSSYILKKRICHAFIILCKFICLMEKSAKSILNKTVFFSKVPVMVNFLAEIVWWFKYQKEKCYLRVLK